MDENVPCVTDLPGTPGQWRISYTALASAAALVIWAFGAITLFCGGFREHSADTVLG
jgi:hypothetical protein